MHLLRVTRPLRVVHLVPTLGTGGMEHMVHLLATSLDRSRFTAEVQLFDGEGAFVASTVAAGTPVRRERRGPGYLDLRLLRRLAAHWKKSRPDVVHAHNITSLVYGTLAGRLAGVPVVYTEHGGRIHPGPVNDRPLHVLAGRLCRRSVAVADWLRDALVTLDHFPASRTEVVPNGIDGAPFRAAALAVDPAAARRELGIAAGASPVAACVARLAKVKNHAVLLDAWRIVCSRFPAATLLVVGSGPERRALEEKAAALCLGTNVRFLGDRHDVPRLLRAADFHVLPSRSEGTSLTLLEAMASGRASIATAVGGNPFVLTHGSTGLLVPTDDASALADAIGTLAGDPALAQAMGAAALGDFERRFTLATMVDRYERIYVDSAIPDARDVRVGLALR